MKQEFIARFSGKEYKFTANPMHIREVAMVIMTEQQTGMIEVWQNDKLQFICRFSPDKKAKAEAEKNGWGWNDFQFFFPEPQTIKPKPTVIVLSGGGVDDMMYGEEFSELHRLIDENEIDVIEREFDSEEEYYAFCNGLGALFDYDERAPQSYVIITEEEYDKILSAEYEEE